MDLIAEKLFTIEWDNGDRLKPRCYIDKGLLEELRKPWKDGVIVTLLGKQIGYFAMRERLKAAWRLTGGMEMVDIGHGFFMVKFDMEVDREKVIGGGPWMIFDHYVAVRPWVADFVASECTINKTMVWIYFPCLGMEYYDENVLTALASATGKPIRVDIRTIDASRGKFARVCVEIDLEQPVVGKVWFRDRWIHVEYEGLHLLCNKCGLFGHLGRNCLKVKPAVVQSVGATKEVPSELAVVQQDYHMFGNEIAIIRGMLSRNWDFQLHHTLREGNQCADCLAKMGARGADSLVVLSSSPAELNNFLMDDAMGVSFVRH